MSFTPNPGRIAIAPSPYDDNDIPLRFPTKGTQESLDFSVDFTAQLMATNDWIVSFTVLQASNGAGALLTIEQIDDAPVSPITVARVSGGSDAVEYKLTFVAACQSGMTVQQDVYLTVADVPVTTPSIVQYPTPGQRGLRGPVGPAGATGAAFYSGSGLPLVVLGAGGVPGDTYTDLTTGEVWRNIAGVWVDSGHSLRGPTGPTGPTGATGSLGPTGALGPTGPAIDTTAGGDLHGTLQAAEVVSIHGVLVQTAGASPGDRLTFAGGKLVPEPDATTYDGGYF